jgi:hypothetical protein
MPTYWPSATLNFYTIETYYIDYNYRFYNCNSCITFDLIAAFRLAQYDDI